MNESQFKLESLKNHHLAFAFKYNKIAFESTGAIKATFIKCTVVFYNNLLWPNIYIDAYIDTKTSFYNDVMEIIIGFMYVAIWDGSPTRLWGASLY